VPPDHPVRTGSPHNRTRSGPPGGIVGCRFAGTAEGERIQQLLEDSLRFDPAPYRGRIDMAFIDAGHDYEHVLRDTQNALAMVRPGGAILWHDYSCWWPGVQKCLDDLSRDLPVFRVSGTALAALRVPAAT